VSITFPPTRVFFQPSGCAIRAVNTLCTDTSSHSEHEHLFRYTSGRWLWDEEQQLRDRYKTFNITELQTLAAKAIGADGCVSMKKLAEGGFNKVFRLLMHDGKSVLVRIPNPNAGPSFYTTASEVATMEFARIILKIPVPQIVGWSATAKNPVGSEYIIMEATGSQLGTVWDEMTPDFKLKTMREVVSIETRMLSISFSHYGSIYFASDAVEGAVPAQIIDDAPAELKNQVAKTFIIGPTVDRDFWNKERSNMDIFRGPWSNPGDYALSIASREMAWIEQHATPKSPDDPPLASSAQNSPQAHSDLLGRYTKVAPFLMGFDKTLTRSTLWHTDLHTSNIFVDNGHITAIIDWQGTWAGPLLIQARPSPLVDYQGGTILKRPENFDELDTKEQARIKQKILKSTLLQLYLMETEERNPVLAKAYNLDHGKTRRLPIELAGNTWDDDIVPFREALINIERYCKELGIEGDCPIHFTEDELQSHLVDAEGWNEVQGFFDGIEDLLKRDGWTHHDTFDAALTLFF
ncbi:uncharacterized protein N7479_005036, partial [Penicillium vulpinum]|uniref:uncharacterized protein n=1 Tax=Penicillium vulpinum TaxID=29845 RepID=UPI0025465EFA